MAQKTGSCFITILLILGAIWIIVKLTSPPTESPSSPPASKSESQKISSQKEIAQNYKKNRLDPKVKERFKEWALRATAVTELTYPNDSNDYQIWVRLTFEKYTTKENVESIAEDLAKAYRMQTGYQDAIIVTVWHPSRDKVFAKGRLYSVGLE